MNYYIRKMIQQDYPLLDTFLYEAIFIPKGSEAPPKEILKLPELQIYIEAFGEKKDDLGFVATVNNDVVGAVWTRIMNDYGHIDDKTPSLAISVLNGYRHLGIGTALINQMLTELRHLGYNNTSLAVQKENYALQMYKKVGYKIVDENDQEYIMLCQLK